MTAPSPPPRCARCGHEPNSPGQGHSSSKGQCQMYQCEVVLKYDPTFYPAEYGPCPDYVRPSPELVPPAPTKPGGGT